MVFQYVGLGAPFQIASSAGTVSGLTNPDTSHKTVVRGLTFNNTNSTTENIAVYNVPNSGGSLGTPSAANEIGSFSLAAGLFFELEFASALILTGENDAIFLVTTTASKVTCQPEGDVMA